MSHIHLRSLLTPSLLTIGLAATFAPSLAHAEDAAAPVAAVRFASLGPDAQRSEINAELMLGHYDGFDDQPLAAHLQAQYMLPSNYGGYLSVSAAKVGDIEAMGNLELGGLTRVRSGDWDIGLRAGLVVPTGTEGGDGLDFLANYLAVLERRPSDLATTIPDFTTLRIAAAPTYRDGPLFLRADIGADVVVAGNDNDADTDALGHLDLGAGYQQGKAAATVEFTTVVSLGSNDDGSLHALTLGGQYDLGSVTGHAAFTIPFETVDLDVFDGAYALSLGVSAPL